MQHIELVLRILVAHFLADFVLQSTKMAEAKDKKGVRSRYFWMHIAIHILTLAALLGDLQQWPILLGISVGHLLTDAFKTLLHKHPVRAFLFDQLIHVTMILVIWLCYTQQINGFVAEVDGWISQARVWGLLLAYLLVNMPTAVLIGKLTDNWSKEIELQSTTGQKGGLKNAGTWIGILERTLILTFVIAGNLSAIGFLLAAKSVFRFGDLKDSRDHKKTEYIIIGTLFSFAFAIGIGLIYRIVFR